MGSRVVGGVKEILVIWVSGRGSRCIVHLVDSGYLARYPDCRYLEQKGLQMNRCTGLSNKVPRADRRKSRAMTLVPIRTGHSRKAVAGLYKDRDCHKVCESQEAFRINKVR